MMRTTIERRRFLRTAAPAIALAAAPRRAPAEAQTGAFPDRPLRLVVPYQAGGPGVDVTARMFAEAAGARLGQPVVVENRPGAGGGIGAAQAARAPADGYTLLWAAGSLFETNPWLYRRLQYRLEDFAPVGAFSEVAFLMAARPGLGVRAMQDLAALMRQRPGAVRYGNSGLGNQLHLTWVRFEKLAGVESLLVNYTGTGTSLTAALLAGDVDVACTVADPAILQLLAGDRLVPLAVTSENRLPQLAAVPTMIEAGFPGFTASGAYSLFAPQATPAPVLDRLRETFDSVVADAAIRRRLEEMVHVVPAYSAAPAYDERLRRDREVWRALVAETGLVLD